MTSRSRRRSSKAQALVEFSLVLIPFLYLLMGVVDLGRGIYSYNGVAQAAREIARVTSVHPCPDPNAATCILGSSSETTAVISTQATLVPGAGAAGAVTIECTDVADNTLSNTNCKSADDDPRYVRVTVRVPFGVVTPLLSMVAPASLSSTTHIEIP